MLPCHCEQTMAVVVAVFMTVVMSVVDGPWSMVLGPWSMVDGPWSMIHGPWSMVHGPRFMVHGQWSPVPGPCAYTRFFCMHKILANIECHERVSWQNVMWLF